MDPFSQEADDNTLTEVPPDEGDVYSAMLGGKYDPNAVGGQLQQQGLLGLALMATGDKAIAPVGEAMVGQTNDQLQGLTRARQALAELGAEQSYRQADLGLRKQEMDQNTALRQGQMALTAQNEQLNRQLNAQLHGTNPDAVQAYAAGARSGDLPPITGWAASTPFGQAVDALLAHPGADGRPFDPSLYGARQRVVENLQKDDQARALNALTQHMGLLQLAAIGKSGGNVQLLNRGVQGLQRQLGDPGITSYDTAANVVADELSRALLPRGGTEKDRQALQASIVAKLGSQQLPANIGTYRNLLRGQIEAKRRQYSLASPNMLNQYLPDIPASEGQVFRSPSTGRRAISIGGQMIEIPSAPAPASVPETAAQPGAPDFGLNPGAQGGW